MKNLDQVLSRLFFSLILIFSFSHYSQAQISSGEKSMIITIETVDQEGNEETKVLKFTGEEVDESRVDDLVQEQLTGEEKSVRVNVEIESEETITTDDEAEEVRVIVKRGEGEDMNFNVEDMEIEIDGDKIIINGEEIEQSELSDSKIKILKFDNGNGEEVEDLLEDMDIDIDEENIFFIDTDNDKKSCTMTGFLGVYMNHEGIEEKGGVEINKVIENSAAEKAGLEVGDIIIEINNEKVASPRELIDLVRGKEVGEEVRLVYKRNNETLSTQVTLGERPNRNADFSWRDGQERGDYNIERRNKARKGDCSQKSCCEAKQDCCSSRNSNMNKARLGVQIEDGQGARITKVLKNTSASRAGLITGDDIIKINKTKIGTADELIKEMSKYSEGDEIKIQVLRKAKKNNLKATLSANDDCCEPNQKRKRIEKQRIIIRKDDLKNNSVEQEFEFDNTLNIENVEIFPNPTRGELNFKFEIDNKVPTDIKVLDLNGQEIYSEKIDNFKGDYENTIDLSTFAEGVYIIQVNQEGKTFTNTIMYSKD